jgi:ankyrin repeat protein
MRSVISKFRNRGVQLDSLECANKLGRLAEKGRIDELRDALAIAPDGEIDQRDANGFTPLQHACTEGHASIVQLLVNEGANPNVRNIDGETALHLAASIGYQHCAEALIAAGARTSLKTKAGKTALELATQMGHLDIVSLLEGAEVDSVHDDEPFSPMSRRNSAVPPEPDARDLAFALLESDVGILHDESLRETATILEMVAAKIAEEIERRKCVGISIL